ncbi:MAG: hypothetical protein N2323_02500 [candidate division WOR-3 bacterium]|nr:hypothetical protein [candidate division WOR-3 bacterium]MCX7836818.1 hypothetical protein [candidate division WOR-3 bacterium]MDW8113865.1 hypothetical protein [candidate division WOR-3 bacterium]
MAKIDKLLLIKILLILATLLLIFTGISLKFDFQWFRFVLLTFFGIAFAVSQIIKIDKVLLIRLWIILPAFLLFARMILMEKIKSLSGLLLSIWLFYSITLAIFTKPHINKLFLKIQNFVDFLWLLSVLMGFVFIFLYKIVLN